MKREKDYGEFSLLMALLSEAYDKPQPTPDRIEIFYLFLEHVEMDAITFRIKNHIRNSKWYPKISELAKPTREENRLMIDAIKKKQINGINKKLIEG